MKTILKVSLVATLLIAGETFFASDANAQRPTIQDLIRNVDNAAARVEEEEKSFLGFKKLELPRPFANLVDIKFRKPELPKFGFLEKLKNIGKPDFSTGDTEQAPLFSGIGKLFTPPEKSGLGFFDRMLGRDTGNSQNLIPESDMAGINNLARELQSQAGRMSREATTNVKDLFGGNSTTPQPPLRSARQYTGNTSRF